MKKMNRLAIRVDGNRHIGLGHFFRCIYLSHYLKEIEKTEVHFFMLKSSLNPQIRRFLEKESLPYTVISREDDPWREDYGAFQKRLEIGKYDGIVVDLLVPDPCDDDLNKNQEFQPLNVHNVLQILSRVGAPILAFSDQFDKVSLKADLIVNTCPTQKGEWYKGIKTTKYLLGPDYYILAPSLGKLTDISKTFERDRPKVVAFFGGNDHRGFTEVILKGLDKFLHELEFEIIVGAATPNGHQKAKDILKRGIRSYFAVADMAPIFFNADFAISASGNTLFDLAALGVPSATVFTRQRQRLTAKFFEEKGCSIDLGANKKEIIKGLEMIVHTVLKDTSKLEKMSVRGKAIVDGRGSDRLIKEMVRIINRN